MGRFANTDMGDNSEEVAEAADCKILRTKSLPNGDVLMTVYRVFDGMYLMYNDFHMSHCYRVYSCLSFHCEYEIVFSKSIEKTAIGEYNVIVCVTTR